jgi:hypothetical protein
MTNGKFKVELLNHIGVCSNMLFKTGIHEVENSRHRVAS